MFSSMKSAKPAKKKRIQARHTQQGIAVRIFFESQEQIDAVKIAAARRGLGFSLFTRLAALSIAEKVMNTPLEKALVGHEIDSDSAAA